MRRWKSYHERRLQMALHRNAFDTDFGIHSNIPECCVKFFVDQFQLFDPNALKYYLKYSRIVERQIRKAFRYRPCPECLLAKRWHELHLCTWDCEDYVIELYTQHGWEGQVDLIRQIIRENMKHLNAWRLRRQQATV